MTDLSLARLCAFSYIHLPASIVSALPMKLPVAARQLLESGQHPGALKDAVCSPGGTTIAGVEAMEQGGFRAAAMAAVTAAYQRTKELAK